MTLTKYVQLFSLEYNIEDKTTLYRNYYNFTLRLDRLRCNDFILTGIRNKLTSAVKKRLITERPFGCLLSGGIDSSIITSIVNKIIKDLSCERRKYVVFLSNVC